MFGGFMLADISFWDMCASGGAFNSESVVVCETFTSSDVFCQCLELRSTINNILRIENFPEVNTLIIAFKGFKNTVSVYTGLAAWKINDFH